ARTTFVGRHAERAEIVGRLGPGRLVTIVGTGGMGKTRLATEIGLRVAPAWPDGVWLVDLSSLRDGSLIGRALADAVGVAVAGRDAEAAVHEHLRARQALLVVDNCEQIVADVAAVVSRLLGGAPEVAVLATSREPLGVTGEEVVRLGPLPVGEDAVALFLDRLGPKAADADPAVVSNICARLDGMPLAIELAASRADVLSAAEILSGLDERFRLLRSRDRTTPTRQRTLQALLDWSL